MPGTYIDVLNHTLPRLRGFFRASKDVYIRPHFDTWTTKDVYIRPHFDTWTTKDVYIRHYYSEYLTLLVVGLKSLRCALYILKCLNITFRMVCYLDHTKIRPIALGNFLLTMVSFPDERAENDFQLKK